MATNGSSDWGLWRRQILAMLRLEVRKNYALFKAGYNIKT